MSLQASNEDMPGQEWTREKKIEFIIESAEEFEGVTLTPTYFENWSDEKIEKDFNFYDYLWTK